jgi:HEPN domain-containing protein
LAPAGAQRPDTCCRRKDRGGLPEDLCFLAQQAAEKALKALLLELDGEFPRTHAIAALLQLAQRHAEVPEEIRDAIDLTDYAVQARYPGDYYPVDEAEHARAIELARRVVDWVAERLARD